MEVHLQATAESGKISMTDEALEKRLPMLEVVNCLGTAWQRTSSSTSAEFGESVSKALAVSLNPGACFRILKHLVSISAFASVLLYFS